MECPLEYLLMDGGSPIVMCLASLSSGGTRVPMCVDEVC